MSSSSTTVGPSTSRKMRGCYSGYRARRPTPALPSDRSCSPVDLVTGEVMFTLGWIILSLACLSICRMGEWLDHVFIREVKVRPLHGLVGREDAHIRHPSRNGAAR